MRLSRAVALLMAIILAATLSQALVSPSQAMRPAPAAHAAMRSPSTTCRPACAEVGNDHFVVVGVRTTCPKVGIFRNIGNGGRFCLYRKIKVTKNNGKFRTRVYQYKQRRTCFRVVAPGDGEHLASTSCPVGCIVTVR